MEQNIVEENTIQPIGNSNGKTLNIIGAFCDRWGFTGVASRFKSVLLNGLAKKGYGINYQILALPGGKGEYYIYKEEGGSKKMIFSNNREHQKDGAIVGKNWWEQFGECDCEDRKCLMNRCDVNYNI